MASVADNGLVAGHHHGSPALDPNPDLGHGPSPDSDHDHGLGSDLGFDLGFDPDPSPDPGPVGAIPRGWGGAADHWISGPSGGDDCDDLLRRHLHSAAVAVLATNHRRGVDRSHWDTGGLPHGGADLQALGGNPSVLWGVLLVDHEKGQVAS